MDFLLDFRESDNPIETDLKDNDKLSLMRKTLILVGFCQISSTILIWSRINQRRCYTTFSRASFVLIRLNPNYFTNYVVLPLWNAKH